MRDVDDDIYPPASTECEENWVEQTVRQMDIMISNAEAKGNHKALAAYSGSLPILLKIELSRKTIEQKRMN